MGIVSKISLIPGFYLLLAVAFGLWLRYRDNKLDSLNEANPKQEPVVMDYSWEELASKGFPMCYRPQLYRNIVKFPNNSACIEEDDCLSYMKNRLLNFYGNREIESFPPDTEKDAYGNDIDSDPEYISLEDYMLLDKYDQYKIDGLSRLGSHDDYNRFLGFDEGLNDFHSYANMGNGSYTYIGAQYFVSADIENGSPLHWAWGSNVFIMLSGRKRWLMIHPKFYDKCNCLMGSTGLFGSCKPLQFRPTDGNISIGAYKDILINELEIPEEYIIDVTLNPGDVLVNCDAWLHAVENLHNDTIAMALRMAQPFRDRPFQTATFKITMKSLYSSLYTKWFHPERHTFIDSYKKGLLENDPRYHTSAALNHKRTFSPLNHKRTIPGKFGVH